MSIASEKTGSVSEKERIISGEKRMVLNKMPRAEIVGLQANCFNHGIFARGFFSVKMGGLNVLGEAFAVYKNLRCEILVIRRGK